MSSAPLPLGEVRYYPYQNYYTNAQAAAFADVTLPIILQARRKRQLLGSKVGSGRALYIAHAALLVWMEGCTLPVPQPISSGESVIPAPMTLGEVARIARVSRGQVLTAIAGEALEVVPGRAGRQPRVTYEALETWVLAGKPAGSRRPPPVRYAIRNQLPQFLHEHALSATIIAERAALLNVQRSVTLSLLRGGHDFLNLYVMAALLPVLSEQVGRPVRLDEIVILEPTKPSRPRADHPESSDGQDS